MKFKAIALGACLAAAPAFADYYVERITVYQPDRYDAFLDDQSGLHSGGDNLGDMLLADDIAMAIADDPRMDGSTVTVVAEDGHVSLIGSTRSPEQNEIAKDIAQDVAAGEGVVSGHLDSQGA